MRVLMTEHSVEQLRRKAGSVVPVFYVEQLVEDAVQWGRMFSVKHRGRTAQIVDLGYGIEGIHLHAACFVDGDKICVTTFLLDAHVKENLASGQWDGWFEPQATKQTLRVTLGDMIRRR